MCSLCVRGFDGIYCSERFISLEEKLVLNQTGLRVFFWLDPLRWWWWWGCSQRPSVQVESASSYTLDQYFPCIQSEIRDCRRTLCGEMEGGASPPFVIAVRACISMLECWKQLVSGLESKRPEVVTGRPGPDALFEPETRSRTCGLVARLPCKPRWEL